MKKIQLYNWYGDAFDVKTYSFNHSLKMYKRQIQNVYDRKKRDIKIHKKINKNLFIKAKTKLEKDSLRTFKSLKIEHNNEIKVLKDSIKELKLADNLKSLIKFELKKIAISKKEIYKYSKNYLNFTKNSGDEVDVKLDNIEKMLVVQHKQEKLKVSLEIYYNLILKFIYKNLEISNLNLHQLNLNKIEKSFVNSSLFSFEILSNLHQTLETTQKNLLATKLLKQNSLKADIAINNQNYKIKVKKLKADFKKRIVDAEADYARGVFELQKENNLELAVSKEKLKQKLKTFKSKHDKKINVILNSAKYYEKIAKLKYRNNLKLQRKIFKLEQTLELINLINEPNDYDIQSLVNTINNTIALIKKYFDNKINLEISALTGEENSSKLISYISDLKITLKAIKNFERYLSITPNLKKYLKFIKSFKHFIFKKEQFFLKLKKAKIEYFKNLAYAQKQHTYTSELNTSKAQALSEYVKYLEVIITDFKIEYFNSFKFLKSEINIIAKEKNKKIFKDYMQVAKSEFDSEMNSIKNSLKTKEISSKAYRNLVKKIKINYKQKLVEIKLDNEDLKHKNILSTSLSRFSSRKKALKKMYEGNVLEAIKNTPIEVKKGMHFVAAFMNVFLPGTAELIIFKQYKKGILLMIASLMMYFLFLPFALGFSYSKIGGAKGLFDLGASIHDFDKGILPDARYWLFGGVASIFLLVFMISFQISSSVSAFRVAKFMKEGTRPSNWTHTKRWLNTSGFPWLISLPGWFLIIFIVITPIITSVLISFTNMGFNHEPPGKVVDWTGLDQYGKWWTYRNIGMVKSLFRVLSWTMIWTIVTASLVIIVGTLFAVALNNPKIKFKKVFRLVYIIPWAIPAFITIIFLKSAFQPDEGSLINLILIKLGIIKTAINWWSDIWIIRTLLIIIQVWLGHSYIFLLVTGHIQSIPKDIYEAGAIDGAKKKQLFRYLTVPSLLAAIAPLLITQFTFTFNNFTIIALFSGGGPQYQNPTLFLEGGTDILISWVYKLTTSVAQIDGNTGFAAAMTTLAALISVSVAAYGFAKTISKGER